MVSLNGCHVGHCIPSILQPRHSHDTAEDPSSLYPEAQHVDTSRAQSKFLPHPDVMLDPFPAGKLKIPNTIKQASKQRVETPRPTNPKTGPAFLSTAVRPLSNYLGLTTLPLHIHEIFFAYALYEGLFRLVSPLASRRLVPSKYNAFTRRDRLNWDAHMVSMYQALFINTVALWVIFSDPQRAVQNGDWRERLWGYNGAAGMVQGFAAGYFLWDVFVSLGHLDVMGVSSAVHAVCALGVTCIGFRPFANYYGLNFILYELSTPFLNTHWFLDKFNKTGSKAQLYNGIALLATFAGSRLVWGSYQSYLIYGDVWKAWHTTEPYATPLCAEFFGKTAAGLGLDTPVGCRTLPAWLAVTYVGANTALSVLNFFWFYKMIRAVRKRFPKGDGDGGAKGVKRGKGRDTMDAVPEKMD
ncbi:hypothetical protein FKW77_010767 [Venturia effusa]|uniref:TLC domain-containing protein n=1 Tax=Venturia effusa TaxID=50376 RepID=A0A517KYE9_9PEZI|nr:hypothetical protein FKW77_010767 [Venturia effusa]